jgi:DNA (cytosine-5)-methyltransferase 1
MWNVMDLFSGTGAFSLEFSKNKNCQVILANDFIKSSKDIYTLNFPGHNYVLDDIHNLKTEELPKFDIITGGISCQPFSIAGKLLGFEDTRSNVFWKMLEIINYHKPKVVIIENVKNLLTHDNGNSLKTIIDNLKQKGYLIKYKVLDTCKITGIPQHRERLYIIGFLEIKMFDNFTFDFPSVKCKTIKEMLENKVNEKYHYTNRYKIYDIVKDAITKENTIYQLRRQYVRENKNNVCPTLTKTMGMGGHNVPLIIQNGIIRKLTPRECFRFQGFPESYLLPPDMSDTQLYQLAGNAISPPIAKLIIDKLISIIK